MTTYSYQGIRLTAKTDTGARRQVAKLIRDGKADHLSTFIYFFRESDGCHGTICK